MPGAATTRTLPLPPRKVSVSVRNLINEATRRRRLSPLQTRPWSRELQARARAVGAGILLRRPFGPLVDGAVDGPALLAELALKVREIVEVVGGRGRRRRGQLAQLRVPRHQVADHLEVLPHVRDDVQAPARPQDALALGRE